MRKTERERKKPPQQHHRPATTQTLAGKQSELTHHSTRNSKSSEINKIRWERRAVGKRAQINIRTMVRNVFISDTQKTKQQQNTYRVLYDVQYMYIWEMKSQETRKLVILSSSVALFLALSFIHKIFSCFTLTPTRRLEIGAQINAQPNQPHKHSL